MPNYYRFEQQFFSYFENLKRNIAAMPLYLGTGSGAGVTITGQLPQTKVSYDSVELATNTTSDSPSLLDNLNHIRYNIETLQDAYLSGAGISGGGGLTQGHIIYDKDVEFTQREKLVLSGAGVTVVDNPSNDATRVEIDSVLAFPDLTDTPDGPYVTESGKYIKINSDGTAIEYGDSPMWGEKIIRLDGGGEAPEQYDANETGLRSALSDSADGDIILIPPKTITVVNDGVVSNGAGALVIPDGVCVRGMSREKTIITADISTPVFDHMCLFYMEGSSYLENLTVTYTRSTSAGKNAYAIYRTLESGYNTGVTLTNVTVVATGVRANGVYAQIYNDSSKIRVAVDNCCFIVYGGAGSLNELKGHSNSNREPVIVRNSVFYVDDSYVESGTTDSTIYGLKVESNRYSTNRIILQDCRFYSHITDPFSNYNYTRSYGVIGGWDFNYDLNSCTSIAINDSTCDHAGALGIGISNYSTLGGRILNCVGIATANSTLDGDENTDYNSYPTYGLSPGNSIVEGGYFEGIDNNAGRALGIHFSSSDAYIYNAVAKGDDGDIYIYRADYVYLYGCQYDTITKYSSPPSGLQTVVYLKGDRSTYTVEDFHADDIEDNFLTRHLPLPTPSGYVAVTTGGKWTLHESSEVGVDEFTDLIDTPSDYSGEAGKSVVVASGETGLEFTTISGVSSFTALTDTPPDYSGQAGKHLVVASGEDAVGFKTLDANLISGAGTDTYVAFFDGSVSLAGDSGFRWDNDMLYLYRGHGLQWGSGIPPNIGIESERPAIGLYTTQASYEKAYMLWIDQGRFYIGSTPYDGDSVDWQYENREIMLVIDDIGWVGIGKDLAGVSFPLQISVDATESVVTTTGGTQLCLTGETDPNLRLGLGVKTDDGYARIQATQFTDSIVPMNLVLQPMGGSVGIGAEPTPTMSGLLIEDGLLTLKETTTPIDDTNYGKIYTKSDNELYFQDGSGEEHVVTFSGAGAGVSTFTELTDTPSDYTGQAGKSVVVTTGEDGLEFTTVSGGGSGSVSTLLIFTALHAELPASNKAVFDTRNLHSVLDFDPTTDQSAIFSAIMPRDYPGDGLTVYIHFAMTSATSGDVVWDVAFERIGSEQQDIDNDGFASAVSSGAVTVSTTSGYVIIASVSLDDGSEIDNIAAGEGFRMKVTRDANHGDDDATGDAEVLYVEIKAT